MAGDDLCIARHLHGQLEPLGGFVSASGYPVFRQRAPDRGGDLRGRKPGDFRSAAFPHPKPERSHG